MQRSSWPLSFCNEGRNYTAAIWKFFTKNIIGPSTLTAHYWCQWRWYDQIYKKWEYKVVIQVSQFWYQYIFILSEPVCQNFPSPERWQRGWRCLWRQPAAPLLLLCFLSLRLNHPCSGLAAGSSRFLSGWWSRSWWSPPSWSLWGWPCPHWPAWLVFSQWPAGL